MGTDRTLNKKPMTRPKKQAGAKRRREKEQRQRLVALGVDEEKAAKMTTKDVRMMLQRPKKLAS